MNKGKSFLCALISETIRLLKYILYVLAFNLKCCSLTGSVTIKEHYLYLLFWVTVSVIWVHFLLWLQVFNKTLFKLDLVYCRESSSCKQCYNRALYKVSNLVSTLFFSLIKYLPQEKKAGIKYLNVSQSVLLKLFPSRANVKT